MVVLELEVPTPEEAARASAKELLEDLGKQAEAIARRRASKVNKAVTLRDELRRISPKLDPDNLIIDPADDDPLLRARRPSLRRELAELERSIAEDDVERRELEPKLSEARVADRLADVACRKASFRQNVIALIQSASTFRNRTWDVYVERETVARDFPQHEFPAPGVTIPAHLGAPAVPRKLVDGLMGLSKLLLESLAAWDPTLFDVQSPERQRAEQITRVENHAAGAATVVQRNRIEHLRAEEARRAAGARDPSPPPKPQSIWDVVAQNEASIAAREVGRK